MSQHTVDDSTKLSNNRNAFDVWNSDTITNGRSQLLSWLSPLNPGPRHWEIQERRVDDIGGWLLEIEEFRRWTAGSEGGEGEGAVLFCYGHPGIGKTFISSLVVDRLCDQASGESTAVSCFYLDSAARKEQSATNVLGSLLKQMVDGMEKIPEEISKAFQLQKTTIGGRRPQLGNIVKMIQLITSSRRAFMCIDALDECSGVQRVRLLDSLKQILEKSPGTRIFATGRPHILAEIEKRLAGYVTSVSISPARGDITNYLRIKLGEDEMPDAMDESLEAEILEKIPNNVSEMFRLVSLNIEATLRESTLHGRREMLGKMSDGLGWGDAYSTTIERIKAQDGDKSRQGMAALMWVSHAERPLKADELCHALAVELGSKDFNAGKVPSISTIVNCCQGLITMDKGISTMRLAHSTVKEYLSARPDIFSQPHSVMAEICLTYLNSTEVKALSADSPAATHGKPFLGYCSVYWGVHAKRNLSGGARSLALELFREYDRHISSKLLLEQVDRRDSSREIDGDLGSEVCGLGHSCPFNGLHCASLFGIFELVVALVNSEPSSINGRTGGHTPLAWAARNGHESVVKMLLGQPYIQPNQSDYSGRTPLSYAAWKGHEEVVKMLLDRSGGSSDEPDSSGKTPLSYAAWKGHKGIVEMLLSRQANPSKPSSDGQTPLSYAASGGHGKVVKILLGYRGVCPDWPANSGRTPLLYAARGGHEGVVKILLGREEVNADKPDNRGKTPLSYAAQEGHEGVVKVLLERAEVSPDRPSNCGQTPLLLAARGGHERVVEMLLGREEVDADGLDDCCRTPLWYAASGGDEEVVKILLGREGVNPDVSGFHGQTPLSCAARDGHEEVVKILLGREEVNPNNPDAFLRTPLSHAAERGHHRIAKILLGREEVNPHKPDKYRRTPLLYAACDGHERVVKMLLGRKEVNPDQPDNRGQTPLSRAASGGHDGVVGILLERKEVNPDKPDNDGRTPLWYASRGGYEGVVKTLLRREEVNPNKPDSRGQTPLMAASECGSQELIGLLQSHEAKTQAQLEA